VRANVEGTALATLVFLTLVLTQSSAATFLAPVFVLAMLYTRRPHSTQHTAHSTIRESQITHSHYTHSLQPPITATHYSHPLQPPITDTHYSHSRKSAPRRQEDKQKHTQCALQHPLRDKTRLSKTRHASYVKDKASYVHTAACIFVILLTSTILLSRTILLPTTINVNMCVYKDTGISIAMCRYILHRHIGIAIAPYVSL